MMFSTKYNRLNDEDWFKYINEIKKRSTWNITT